MHLQVATTKKKLSNQEIKAALHEEGPLSFKEFSYEGESIEELINIFAEYSFRFPTLNSKGNQMCAASKRRSFCDVYCFIINHRPNATVKTVKAIIRKLILEAKIQPAYCPLINRGTLLFAGFNASGRIPPEDYKTRLDKQTEFGCTMGEFYELK